MHVDACMCKCGVYAYIIIHLCALYECLQLCMCGVFYVHKCVYTICERVAAEREMDVRGGERATVGVCMYTCMQLHCVQLCCAST